MLQIVAFQPFELSTWNKCYKFVHVIFCLDTRSVIRIGFFVFRCLRVDQAWILAPDIGQCPEKNWVMFDKRCFRMSTVVWREVLSFKIFQKVTSVFKTHKNSVSILSQAFPALFFYEHFNTHMFYVQNCKMCLSKKFYTNTFLLFYPAWGSFFSENVLYGIT